MLFTSMSWWVRCMINRESIRDPCNSHKHSLDIRALRSPSFIVQERKLSQYGLIPLQQNLTESRSYRKNWFPSSGLVQMSEKGSIKRDTIPCFIRHLEKYVRQCLQGTTSYLHTLDSHKSRLYGSDLSYVYKTTVKLSRLLQIPHIF